MNLKNGVKKWLKMESKGTLRESCFPNLKKLFENKIIKECIQVCNI